MVSRLSTLLVLSSVVKLQQAYLASREGFEPPLVVLETIVLPLTLARHCMAESVGIEPTRRV